MTDTTTITVAGEPGYDITIGRGLLANLGETLPAAAQKVLVVHPPTLAAQAEALRAQLVGDRQVLLAEIPDAELEGVIESAEECPGECIFIEAE